MNIDRQTERQTTQRHTDTETHTHTKRETQTQRERQTHRHTTHTHVVLERLFLERGNRGLFEMSQTTADFPLKYIKMAFSSQGAIWELDLCM